MRRTFTLVVALAAVMALAGPVSAITRGGQPDDGEHPYVGLMVAYEDETFDHDGDPKTRERQVPLWRCSGALVSPTVFVTAGHCTGPESSAADAATPAYAAIWFGEQVTGADGYPWYEEAPHTGIPYAHESYDPDAFYLHDAGVVELDRRSKIDEYARLPALGALDELGQGRNNATIEAVGYGLQQIYPIVESDLDRRKADLFLVDDRGVAGLYPVSPDQQILVSGDAAHGGTCFGDSGGPQFIDDTNVIGAVTSFGLNGACGGVGGGYRLDQPDDLAWLSTFTGSGSGPRGGPHAGP